MSNLSTVIIECAMLLKERYLELIIIGIGLLLLLGSVFNWKWTWRSRKTFGFNAWVYSSYGEKGARINIGITGAFIIASGVLMWVIT